MGRSHEQTQVLRAWAQGQAVLLQGEAGLGKSRLMQDLLNSVGTGPALGGHGLEVLRGAGRPGDGAAPYTTMSRLLQPIPRRSGLGLDRTSRQALSLLLPGFDLEPPHTRPGAGAAQALPPGAIQTAVAAWLQQAQVHTVALDDLHFADNATLDLLAGLVAQPELSLRWLLASRPAEASGTTLRLLEGLCELHRLQVVRLSPLDASAVAQLITSLDIPGLTATPFAAPALPGGSPRVDAAPIQGQPLVPNAAPDQASSLLRHTGGNPLFLLETLKQGLADGSLLAGRRPPAAP